MTVRKILLVDDSKTELHHLSDLLTKRGYAVRTAENAEEAMRRLEEEKPEVVLMDVVMPGQNGFQLTRAITRDPR
jgi:twitching motility two-component system response regulator PilH